MLRATDCDQPPQPVLQATSYETQYFGVMLFFGFGLGYGFVTVSVSNFGSKCQIRFNFRFKFRLRLRFRFGSVSLSATYLFLVTLRKVQSVARLLRVGTVDLFGKCKKHVLCQCAVRVFVNSRGGGGIE